MGLGIAYAGSAREDLLELLVPIVVDTGLSVELSALAALSLGLIFVGKVNEEVSNAILQTLAERTDVQLDVSIARFFALGLGLLFLGQQERSEATIEALGIVSHHICNDRCIYCSQVCIRDHHLVGLCFIGQCPEGLGIVGTMYRASEGHKRFSMATSCRHRHCLGGWQ